MARIAGDFSRMSYGKTCCELSYDYVALEMFVESLKEVVFICLNDLHFFGVIFIDLP